MIEEMLRKANEEVNAERMEEVQNRVRSYVDEIVRLESSIMTSRNKIDELKVKLKSLETPEELKVEL